MLAKAECQAIHLSLTQRIREQARSHNLTEFKCKAVVICFSVEVYILPSTSSRLKVSVWSS